MPSHGEDGGRWLQIPNLVGKRLDVVVMPKTRGRPSFIQMASADQIGYIEIQEPITEAWLSASPDKMKTVTVRIGQGCKKVKLQPCWLKPCRTTEHPPQVVAKGIPITQCMVRVVIIGPDIDGDNAHRGEYGMTWPGTDPGQVLVSFQRRCVKDPEHSATYRIDSLCRALNADGVTTTRTIFV